MILKDYTYNDYYLWWAIDRKMPQVEHDYILQKPTEYATKIQLGSAFGGLNSISLHDDFRRDVRNKRLMSSMFMTNFGHDYAYSALSGEPIEHIAESVTIRFRMMPDHKNLTERDYWAGTEKDPVHFSPVSMARYFYSCDKSGFFISPQSYDIRQHEPESHIISSALAPKTEQEIRQVNTWSYLAFGKLWDCEALDEEFREEVGLDILMQQRHDACYI